MRLLFPSLHSLSQVTVLPFYFRLCPRRVNFFPSKIILPVWPNSFGQRVKYDRFQLLQATTLFACLYLNLIDPVEFPCLFLFNFFKIRTPFLHKLKVSKTERVVWSCSHFTENKTAVSHLRKKERKFLDHRKMKNCNDLDNYI